MTAASQSVDRLRNRPQQARSRARLEKVLAAADDLLAREGADAITTTRVAAEAGVSIGSLYHYLPDRDAILHALALRYLSGFEAQMQQFVLRAKELRWDDLVGTVLDGYAAAYREQPGFRALWFGRHLSERTWEADRAHKQAMSAGLHQLLLAFGVPDDNMLPARCRAAHLAADALVQEAFRTDPNGDDALLGECKVMLAHYLEVARRGQSRGE
ncbi:TetR/AcrR family transcriptional regulator [Nocardia sp. NPDC058633]|uniref:TetR/AcrR family transcriptional regulator n=1 Tax=Nocardia sp. NPDC058633 TaxID=3346568 RepID=UPI0036470610